MRRCRTTIPQYKVFDIHTHAYPDAIAQRAAQGIGEFYSIPIRGKGTFGDLYSMHESFGSTGFLMFAAATNPTQVVKANDYIAGCVKNSPGLKLAGFAAMHQDYEDKAGEVERVKALGLKGFKLHPDVMKVDIDDPNLYSLYEAIEGVMPICLHIGDNRYSFSSPERLLRIKKRFPKLAVLAAHLGGYTEWDNYERNFWGTDIMLDTSSALWALSPERAGEIIRKHGVDKVYFGTDYPVNTVSNEYELFMKLELTHEQRKAILCDNALKLLGL
ncbi:MAG: amidohydrolase family protein [Eubacteriales bacterium]